MSNTDARFVPVADGIEFFCADDGDGAAAPVVLLHSWLCDSDDWIHLIPLC